MRSRLLGLRTRAGTLGAMHMYNKLGAAFMFLMAGGCLFFLWGSLGSEGGAWGTAFWLVFAPGFAALGVWALRQR